MNPEITTSGLTDKQERFAHEYLLDQNASAACLRAGYSAHSHAVQGAQLMAHPGVRGRIRGLLEELYSRIKLDAVRLMQARVDTAFFDPRTLVDAGNKPRPLGEWSSKTADVMLVSFDVRANGETVLKVRQPSRAAALTALERRFAQFAQLQQEDTITQREQDRLQLSLGRDPASIKPGEVVRFTNRVRRWETAPEPEPGSEPGAGLAPAPALKPEPDTVTVAAGAAVPAPARETAAVPAARRPAPAAAIATPAVASSPAATPTSTPASSPTSSSTSSSTSALAAAPALMQRIVGAARRLVRSDAAAPGSALDAGPQTAYAAPALSAKAKAQQNYWCDLSGNIDIDHPRLPPEVKARELEKRRLRQLREEERNQRGRELHHLHGGAGRPKPPGPRDPRPGRQRAALNHADDPWA